jgi:hypothetical protein
MPPDESRAEEVDRLLDEEPGGGAVLRRFVAQDLQQTGRHRILEAHARQKPDAISPGHRVGARLQMLLREIDVADHDRTADVPVPVVASGIRVKALRLVREAKRLFSTRQQISCSPPWQATTTWPAKHPETSHYTGDGVFMVFGEIISRRSLFRPGML